MSLLLTNRIVALLLLLGLFTAFALQADRRGREYGGALAIDVEAARALCLQSGYPEDYFWERARTIGVVGAVLRPEPLAGYMKSGKVHRYTEAEIVKLRATGVASPEAPLRPGVLWIEDDDFMARLSDALSAHDIPFKRRRYQRMHVLELGPGLPKDFEPGELSAGYDPVAAKMIAAHGLVPVYRVESEADLRLALATSGTAVLQISPGLPSPERIDLSRLSEGLRSRDLWVAFVKNANGAGRRIRAFVTRGIAGPLTRVLTSGELPAGAGLSRLLREISGCGNRLIVTHLDASRGLEGALDELRTVLKGMRQAGYHQSLPTRSREVRRVPPGEWFLRFALGFLLTVAGPILAMRIGLQVLRWARRSGRLPEAAPFLEVALGMIAIGGVGAAVGLTAYSLLAVGVWRLEATFLAWGHGAAAVTLCAAFLALFIPDVEDLFRRRRMPSPPGSRGQGPEGRRRKAAVAASLRYGMVLAGVALLLFTPGWLRHWGPEAWLERIAAWQPAWWWVGGRWRELLVGYPCMFVGLCVYYGWMNPSQGRAGTGRDPRLWLLFGMFAPVGLAEVLARAQTPFEMALLHTTHCAAAGLFLGLLLFGATNFLRVRIAPSGAPIPDNS